MENKTIKLILKVRQGFPKAQLVYFLIIILKLLPLFILTHDWNLNYQKGISSILFQLTLGQTFNKIKEYHSSIEILVIVISLISVIPVVFFYMISIKYKKYGKLFPHQRALIFISSLILFYLPFFCNQYFYAIMIEIFFCKGITDPNMSYPLIVLFNSGDSQCRNTLNYVIMCIQGILFCYFIIMSYMVTILCFEPFCTSKRIIVNNLCSHNLKWVIFPLLQIIIQLELHVPFSYMVYIKSASRAFYMIFYLKHIFYQDKTFYTNHKVFFITNYVLSMCFVSCIIEFAFLYDYSQNLIILQSQIIIIVFKFLLEIFSAGIIMKIVEYYELQLLSNKITIITKSPLLHYDYFNKIFFYLQDTSNFDIMQKIFKNFYEIYKDHKKLNKCDKEMCYCQKFSIEDVYKQSCMFVNMMKFSKSTHHIDNIPQMLKSYFPLLYHFLEDLIISTVEKYKGSSSSLYSIYLLISVIFYMVFDRNFNRALFFLEEFMTTRMYKKSFIIRVQVRLIKIKLLEDYKHFLLTKKEKYSLLSTLCSTDSKSFQESNKVYKRIVKSIYLEKCIQSTFQCYLDLLSLFNVNDINYNTFYLQLAGLARSMDMNNYILRNFYGNDQLTNQYFCAKLSIYFKYFFNEVPREIKDCFKNIFDADNFLTKEDYSTLILNFSQEKERMTFNIEYASDDFCHLLGYSIDELKKKDFLDIVPTSLVKAYSFKFVSKIKTGNVVINIRDIVLLEKENYAKVFDLAGIVIFVSDGLKIFAKIHEHKSRKEVSITIPKIKNKDIRRKNLQIRDTCFIIANKRGKITAISREFEKYFNLSVKIIKKIKIDIFKDLLKIEKQKDRVIKKLLDIYKNIDDLNVNQLTGEFFKNETAIKEIQKKFKDRMRVVNVVIDFEEKILKKNENTNKEIYFVIFTIELENHNTAPLESFFGITLKEEGIIDPNAMQSSLNCLLLHKKETLNSQSEKKTFRINMCENKSDIVEKINLIKAISITLLGMIYGIQKDSILNEEHRERENSRNTRSSIPSAQKASEELEEEVRKSANVGGLNKQLNNTISYKIKIQMLVWIVYMLLFIAFLFLISSYQNKEFSMLLAIIRAQYFLTISKNILLSAVSSSLYLQFQANHIQREMIDNNFPNDYNYHRTNLDHRIKDYLNYLQLYQSNWEISRGSSLTQGIEDIMYERYEYVKLGFNGKSEILYTSLSDSIKYIHLQLGKLLYDKLDPLFFNITIRDGSSISRVYSLSPEKDFIYSNAAASSVFIVENFLTNIKYPLDEILTIYNDVAVKKNKESSLTILGLSMGLSSLLLCFFIEQTFVYHSMYNVIFAKYYIHFNYLRYFQVFLTRKTMLLKDFFENSIVSKIIALENTKVVIINSLEENAKIKEILNTIDNPLNVRFTTFNVTTKENKKTKLRSSQSPQHPHLLLIDETPRIHFSKYSSNYSISDNFNNPPSHLGSSNHEIKNLNEEKNLSKFKIKDTQEKEIMAHNETQNHNNNPINTTTSENFLIIKNGEERGKSQILRPNSFYRNLFVFIAMFVFIFIISLINFVITTLQFDIIPQICKAQTFIFERYGLITELLLIYQISILKNEVLTCDYKSHGYLNKSELDSYKNSIVKHNSFEEVMNTSPYFAEGLLNFTNGNEHSYLNSVVEYVKAIDYGNLCEIYAKFYCEQLPNNEFPVLNSMINATNQTLQEPCEKIGRGLNKKGMVITMNSLETVIVNLYNDFLNDEEKTPESMYKRLNDPALQIYQVEVDTLFDKMFINYLLAIRSDLNSFQDRIAFYESLYQVCIIILLIFLGFFYAWQFSCKYRTEDKVINELEESIYNTLIF